MELLDKLIQSLGCILIFYHFIKLNIFKSVEQFLKIVRLKSKYPVEVMKGVIELPIVVVFHLGLSFLLLTYFSISITDLGLNQKNFLVWIGYGILIGIGMMGFSSLLCRALIEVFRKFPGKQFPKEVRDWLIMSRSGWLRHHLHTLEVLSLPFALTITLGQVVAEEVIFRGILIHYFLPFGAMTAVLVSTSFFMLMQIFHMPSILSAIFPMVDAAVIGVVNSILFLNVHNLIPLVVAHFTLFVVAVL